MAAWREAAACRDQDPELWFPIGNTGPALVQIKEAKRVCRRCPVREECLRFAVNAVAKDGIFGGLDEKERELLRHNDRRRAVPQYVGRAS